MALKDEIENEVKKTFRDTWTKREGIAVPVAENLQLGNDSVLLDATILYADITDSTVLVDGHRAHFAAEVYKAFLHAAAKIIRSESGEITAYDGDRVMAVFIGKTKNTSATRAALKINYVCTQIINPAIKAQYPKTTYELKHVVGIDTSKVFVARTGVRGANDLVWVGRAANHAAKMSALSSKFPSRISEEVYNAMLPSVKTSTDGRSMWEKVTWTDMNRQIYRSNWRWPI